MGRVPEPGESVWTEEDRTKVVAWMVEQRLACPRCGTNEHTWAEHPMLAVEYRCPGCEQLDILMHEWREEARTSQFGLHFKLVPPDLLPDPKIPEQESQK